MTIPARISIVTIGVEDVARSARFYEALGWERCASSMDEIAWFGTADGYLGSSAGRTWPTTPSSSSRPAGRSADHARDQRRAPRDGRRRPRRGGRGRRSLLKPGTELPFGYGGYFADPDGHAWEVCWNPGFPIGPDGRITID